MRVRKKPGPGRRAAGLSVFQQLAVGHDKFADLDVGQVGLLGKNSLEIYLLNVSVFSQIELLRKLVSFGPSNRLYFLLMFAVNIVLGCLLHRLVEWGKAQWKNRRRAAPFSQPS